MAYRGARVPARRINLFHPAIESPIRRYRCRLVANAHAPVLSFGRGRQFSRLLQKESTPVPTGGRNRPRRQGLVSQPNHVSEEKRTVPSSALSLRRKRYTTQDVLMLHT